MKSSDHLSLFIILIPGETIWRQMVCIVVHTHIEVRTLLMLSTADFRTSIIIKWFNCYVANQFILTFVFWCYLLKILQLNIWLQSYKEFVNAKNNIKQRNLNTVFAQKKQKLIAMLCYSSYLRACSHMCHDQGKWVTCRKF